MPVDSTKIKIAGSGAVWYAPAGTTLPTDSTTALASGFVNIGYVKDGFLMDQDLATKEVAVWQSLEPVRSIPTSVKRGVKFEAVETNKTTLKLAFGGATVTAGTGSAYTMALPASAVAQEFILVLDWNDGSDSQRIVIKRATFKALPSIKFSREDNIGYAFEIRALAPADGSDSVAMVGVSAGVVA